MADKIGKHTGSHTLCKRAALVILLLSVLPFLILTIFSNPAYDDYGFAITAMKRGFLTNQKLWFYSTTGRYFSTAVLTMGPITFGSFIGYKIVALIIILLTFASIFSFITAILVTGVALVDRLVLAGLIMALFSNQMPDVTEGYYWMPGSISYQLASALTLFFMTLMIRSVKRQQGSKAVLFLAGSALIFAIVGSSETSMIILLLLVSSVTIKAFSIKSASRRLLLAFLTVTVLCAVVVISAPGNAARSSYAPGRHRFFFSVAMSLAQGAGFLLDWLTNPAFILSTLLFIPAADMLSVKSGLLRKHLYVHPLTSVFLLLSIVFLGFFSPYWATGMLYQYRTVNTVFFFFLLGWFISILICVSYLKEKRRVKIPRLPQYVYLISLPVISLALLFSNNTRTAMADLLTGRAYYYDREVRKRRSLLERCAREGRGDCQIQKLDDLPETTTNPYFETEVSAEQQYWEARTSVSGSQQ